MVTLGRVIMVDWSAADGPGPVRPTKDRCWLAWGDRGTRSRPEPEYFRTRGDCANRIVELASEYSYRVLIGFDFPFGYPSDAGLPAGCKLCEFFHKHLTENATGHTNRFELAGTLNLQLAQRHELATGPFWGHPARRVYANLTATKPRHPLREWRIIDLRLRDQGFSSIQSVYKLAYTGSVGSQTITGLACVGGLLRHHELKKRALLWPFETRWSLEIPRSSIIIAEIWPALVNFAAHRYDRLVHSTIKDARQVAAMRDVALDDPNTFARALKTPASLSPHEERACREREGWILGAGMP